MVSSIVQRGINDFLLLLPQKPSRSFYQSWTWPWPMVFMTLVWGKDMQWAARWCSEVWSIINTNSISRVWRCIPTSLLIIVHGWVIWLRVILGEFFFVDKTKRCRMSMRPFFWYILLIDSQLVGYSLLSPRLTRITWFRNVYLFEFGVSSSHRLDKKKRVIPPFGISLLKLEACQIRPDDYEDEVGCGYVSFIPLLLFPIISLVLARKPNRSDWSIDESFM